MLTPIHTPDESATALGAFFCLVWLVILVWWLVAKSRVVADTVAWFRRKAVPAKILAVAAFTALTIHAGIKSGGNEPLGGRPLTAPAAVAALTQADLPPFALVEARPNGVVLVEASTNAGVSESCLRHGTSEGGEWIEAAAPFFRWGTNDIQRLYASPGCLSFGTMRHPFHGDMLPNGTDAESLVALRAPLGIVPEANWRLIEGTNVASRFWHDRLPGGGRVFTWENALLDRLADRPATIQVELRSDGDFTYRYDFSVSGPPGGRPLPEDYPAATPGVVPAAGHNPVLIGAQKASAAVEAFRSVGSETNGAVVYRLDGDTATNGVSIADLLATAPLLELRWKNVAGLGDLSGDTDGDCLTDWQEIFLHGTDPRYADTDGDGRGDGSEIAWGDDPFDADENADGVPDGISAADWAANTLWAANATNTAHTVTVTLNSTVPAGSSASLMVGNLCIPLCSPSSWTLGLVPGEVYPYRLNVGGGTEVDLAIAPACGLESPDLFPFWLEGDGGVFDEPSPGGAGDMAIPVLTLEWIDPSDGSHEDGDEVCVHKKNGSTYQYGFLPAAINAIPDAVVLTRFTRQGATAVYLPIESGGGRVLARIGLQDRFLRWGFLFYEKSAHLCCASFNNPYCQECGHYMPVDLTLYLSQDVLTLKHDNEVTIVINHGDTRTSTVTDPSIQIRRLGETNWLELAASDGVSPWTARVAGYFELQGKLTVDGQDAYTDIRGLEVQFPTYAQIWSDSTVIGLANQTWQHILVDCTPETRRERGFWIKLDTTTGMYFRDQEIPGPLVTNGVSAYVNLGPRPANVPISPSPLSDGAIYAVATFHGHTPTTYTGRLRYIGPSEGDVMADRAKEIPGIVYDFVEHMPNSGYIPAGWPKTGAYKFYKTPGYIRRPTE